MRTKILTILLLTLVLLPSNQAQSYFGDTIIYQDHFILEPQQNITVPITIENYWEKNFSILLIFNFSTEDVMLRYFLTFEDNASLVGDTPEELRFPNRLYKGSNSTYLPYRLNITESEKYYVPVGFDYQYTNESLTKLENDTWNSFTIAMVNLGNSTIELDHRMQPVEEFITLDVEPDDPLVVTSTSTQSTASLGVESSTTAEQSPLQIWMIMITAFAMGWKYRKSRRP